MNLSFAQLFYLLFSSFFLTTFLTPLARNLAVKIGMVDKPNQSHKTHAKPVPYLGGVAIAISTTAVVYAASLLAEFPSSTFLLASTILVPALMMFIVGLIDDYKQLSPWPRFLAQNLIGFIVAVILISTNTLGAPTGYLIFDLLVTLLWIVGLTNSINFFDNIDGGASGTVAISAVTLTLLGFINGQYLVAAMAAVLAGSTLGFLAWNKPPARIYMGDAGSLFLGTLIAALSIRLDSPSDHQFDGLLIIFFLLAMPVLDTTIVFFHRIKIGKSPFEGGRDHLSHRLITLGINRRFAVMILWSMSLVFCLFSLVLFLNIQFWSQLFKALGLLAFLLLFAFFWRIKVQPIRIISNDL